MFKFGGCEAEPKATHANGELSDTHFIFWLDYNKA